MSYADTMWVVYQLAVSRRLVATEQILCYRAVAVPGSCYASESGKMTSLSHTLSIEMHFTSLWVHGTCFGDETSSWWVQRHEIGTQPDAPVELTWISPQQNVVTMVMAPLMGQRRVIMEDNGNVVCTQLPKLGRECTMELKLFLFMVEHYIPFGWSSFFLIHASNHSKHFTYINTSQDKILIT